MAKRELPNWLEHLDFNKINAMTDDELVRYSGLLHKYAKPGSKAHELGYDLMYVYVQRGRTDSNATHSAVYFVEEENLVHDVSRQ